METHICVFTTLDDLPKKDHADPVKVLRAVMNARGRFSIFDATSTKKLAESMTFIERKSGWVRRRVGHCAYPWIEVELTDEGRQVLEG